MANRAEFLDVSATATTTNIKGRAYGIRKVLGEANYTAHCLLEFQLINAGLECLCLVSAKSVEDFLDASRGVCVDCCRVDCALIADTIDVAVDATTILLSYRLFIL